MSGRIRERRSGMNILVVVDMQKDFIDGSLGTKEAVGDRPRRFVEKIRRFDGKVIATRDTHGEDYLESAEGDIFRRALCERHAGLADQRGSGRSSPEQNRSQDH